MGAAPSWAKRLRNDAGTRWVLSEPGNHDIVCEHTVLLKALKVCLGNVRLFIDVNAVSDVLKSDDPRTVVHVMLSLEVRAKRAVCDRIWFGRCKLLKRRPRPALGKRWQLRGVWGGGFFVFAAASPVLAALGEDALQELFAGFVSWLRVFG